MTAGRNIFACVLFEKKNDRVDGQGRAGLFFQAAAPPAKDPA